MKRLIAHSDNASRVFFAVFSIARSFFSLANGLWRRKRGVQEQWRRPRRSIWRLSGDVDDPFIESTEKGEPRKVEIGWRKKEEIFVLSAFAHLRTGGDGLRGSVSEKRWSTR
jgi:hypothetical protein